MKTILKLILALSFSMAISSAMKLDNSTMINDLNVTMSSQKSIVVGNNKITITITKNGKTYTDAKVKLKIFMPEMPGMPYMESKAYGKLDKTTYKLDINFPMSGTWQYKLYIKDTNKIKTTKGGINI